MKYFDKTFFRFLFGFMILILIGLVFVSRVEAALVNINTASLTELDTLPGVGPATAQSIINARPYASVQEISRADGIGESGSPSYENIINLITVGEVEAEAEENEETVSESSGEGSSSKKEEKAIQLKVSVEADKLGVVGSTLKFKAVPSARSSVKFYWSFGDGSTARGESVSHSYAYPGEYVVVLRAESGRSEALARASVRIVPDTLSVTSVSAERVEVFNSGKDEINLFGRKIVSNGKEFIFPPDTIIKGGQKISFPSAVTGLGGNSAKIALATERISDIQETDKAKTAEIEAEILSLQRKQIEIRKNETEQLAAPIAAASTTPSKDIDESQKGWFKTLKKFFGFR